MGVNKVVLGNDTVMDITDSTVTSENLLKNEVAYGANGNRIVGSFDADKYVDWESNNYLGAKNIIKFPYVYGSGTSHGLTITVNDDGSVTASGQPTQTITFPLVSNLITEYELEVGDKLIISESGVENNNASAALIYINPSGAISLVQGDYELTVTSEMVTKGVAFILWFNTGVDLTTPVTFKPMIRLDTDPDDDWVPPTLTNRKLTEWVLYLNDAKSTVQANPSGTSTGNLTAISINGVIYAVQGGGSNVQSDWNQTDTTADDYIKNKPTIPDISTKVSKAGDTMTGRLNFTFDTAEINFRQNHASYDGVISYQTAGNEAWLFTTKNAVTSIMFVNGEDTITNIASNRWQSLTPGLQIKNNKVAIGKLIASGTTPTHALDVSGTTNIEAGSDTPLRIKRNSDTGACYMGFYNNSGVLGYFAVLADKRPYFEPGGGSDTRIALWGDNISKFNNDSKYITGITKAMVTTALGYTPPTSDTNDKVTVQHSTSNAQYPVMFEGHNNQTTYTTGVFKTAYVTVNPYNACMYVKHTSNGHFTRIIPEGIYFRNDTEGSRIYDGGSQALWFMASGENDYKVFFGVADSMWTLCPGKNGYIKLGSPNFKWAQIYSTSGSINTSDRKEKKDIVPLDDSAVDFIMALNPVSYKMINGESGRTHYGMIAQDVEEELAELGMTAMDFAGFCKDEKRVRIESVEEGRVVTKEQKKPGEYAYGLRYEEFIAPLIKTVQLQQEDINSLKEEISLLKEEIALLKQRLKILEDK